MQGAVEDSRDFPEAVPGESFLNADDRRNPSGDGRAKLDAATRLSRQREKFGAVLGDENFVRRDHGFSGAQRFANPVTGGADASD